MAALIGQGIVEADGAAIIKPVHEVSVDELLTYDGMIIGSPTYYGSMAYQIKRLIDESVKLHGKLAGKIGGAFSSAANVGGGNETTILSIVQALLIHGMIVLGIPRGDHYGPVAINNPDSRSTKLCIDYGKQLSILASKLYQ